MESTGAPDVVMPPCDLCGSQEEVNWFCQDCQENICNRCKIGHQGGRKTKNDEIVPITQARYQTAPKIVPILCDEHKTKLYELYCEKCEQLICSLCLDKNHKSHEIFSVEKLVQLKSSELGDFEKLLHSNLSSWENVISEESQQHSDFMSHVDGLMMKVKVETDKIIQEFTKTRDKHISDLSQLKQRAEQMYKRNMNIIQTKTSDVRKSVDDVKNVKESGNAQTMIKTVFEIKQKIPTIGVLTVSIRPLPNFQQNSFQPTYLLQLDIPDIEAVAIQTPPAMPVSQTGAVATQSAVDMNKVKVKTGEEDEDRLFGERAKLFRFDMDAKQWKERGIGEMKILKHKVNYRSRVLMRSDQVLKLCANHYLTEGMKLTPMPGMDKGWCWVAMDYAQEELQTERLAVKFKTKDMALQFKAMFEKCVAELENGTVDKVIKVIGKEDTSKSNLSELFKRQTGDWSCTECLVSNPETAVKCLTCTTLKPGAKPVDMSAPSTGGFKLGDASAFTVSGAKPVDAKATSAQSTGRFKFGDASTFTVIGAKPVGAKATSVPSSGGFKFGDASASTGIRTKPIVTTATSSSFAEGFKFREASTLLGKETKPVDTKGTSAPSARGFKFGDTSASTLTGAKLVNTTAISAPFTVGFKFGNASASIGTGAKPVNTKSATAPSTGGLMFGDSPVSICTSAPTTSSASSDKRNAGFTFGRTGNTGFVFSTSTPAVVTTSDSVSKSSFACRKFATTKTTTESTTRCFSFGKITSATTSFTFGTATNTLSGSSNKENARFTFGSIGNTSFVFGKSTPATVTTSDYVSKPSFTFRKSAATTSTTESITTSFTFEKTISALTDTTSNKRSFTFGTGPGFFSALQAFPGQENAQVIGPSSLLPAGSSPVQGSLLMEALTKSSSAPAAVTMTTVSMPPNAVAGPSIQARPNLVQGLKPSPGSSTAAFSISQSVPSQPFSKALTTLATGSNMPLFGSLVAAAKSPDKSNVDTEINVTIHPVTSDSRCSNSENFGGLTYTIDSIITIPKSGSAPSFADLAESSANTNLFKMQTGTPGFTMKSPATLSPVKSPGKDDDNTVEEYEPRVDFKPVVELPDLVEVKTGEEDEDRLFAERAKLFRFDLEAKQWKERGVGELKILKHKVTHRARVLMRREQVLKLCANHYLTEGMKLTPMPGMDKGWCWVAMDYAQEELQTERLAVKFKTKDMASKFKEVFEECVAELENGTVDKEVTVKPKTPEKSDVPALPSLTEMFKPKPGQWTCDTCMITNDSSKNMCAACNALKPGLKPEDIKSTTAPPSGGFQFGTNTAGGFKFRVQPTSSVDKKSEATVIEKEDSSKPSLLERFKPKAGDWSCTECLVSNPVTEVKCLACTTPKPGAKPVATTALPAPSAGGFKFGDASASTGIGAKPVDTKATSLSFIGGFKFGDASASTGIGAKPDDTKATSAPSTGGFKFGNAPASTGTSGSLFSFVPSTTTTSTVTTKVAESKPSGFVFGTSSVTGDGAKSDTKGGSVGSKETSKVLLPESSGTASTVTTTSSASSNKGNTGLTFGSTGNTSFVFGTSKAGTVTTSDIVSKPSFTFRKTAATTTTTESTTTSFTFGKTTSATTTTDTTTNKANFTFGTENKPTKQTTDTTKSAAKFTFSLTPDKKTEGPSTSGFQFNFDKPATPVSGNGKTEGGKISPAKFTFTPTSAASKPVVQSPKSPETDADGRYINKEGEDDHLQFEPVIKLPDKVEVVTGEEDDIVLFEHRAKLYRLHDKQWKERGLGNVKILCHKETGKCRLLMRREQVLKICCHHHITDTITMQIMPNSQGRALIWFAMDFTDIEEPVGEKFSIRFKSADIAEKFKEKFEEAQKKSSKKETLKGAEGGDDVPKVLPSAAPTSSKPKPEKSEDNSDDVIFVKEEKATPKQVELARRYFLPDNFYLYEKKPPCPGCRGCEERESDTSSSAAGLKESPVTSKAKPVAQPVSLFSAGSATVKPAGGVFGDVSSTDTESASKGGSKSVISQPSEASGASSSTVETTDGAQGGSNFFGSTNPSFSFASLAAQANGGGKASQKDDNKPFSWTDAGQQLFGAGGDGEGDEVDEVVQGDDPHFEPVIPLPDLVKPVTGEEGMTVLFNVRAKLFRFDTDSKQWKEKGIGEMKILKDPTSGKVRLLLRREQVLKLACNHWLTPDINVKPLATSETSWCWTAQDFCEAEPKTEQFAVKFKNTDIAAQFKEIVDSCQKDLQQNTLSREDKVPIQVSEVSSNVNLAASGDACSARKEEVDSSQDVEGSNKAGNKDTTTDDGDDDGDDDDDDYEDVEEEVLFEKRLTLFVKDGDQWKSLGVGQLKITLDDDVIGNRITMETDKHETVCNHIIVQESVLQINKKKRYCEWSPLDFSTDEPVRRDFKAQFSSEAAVEEFQKVFKQGELLARESDISERNMVTPFPKEIDIPEVHSHNASED